MPAPVDITDPFRGLSDPTRREIVNLLAAGPLPVRMIAGHFPSISRPAVSKHLRILREGTLVREERSGRERFYSLNSETLESTLGWLSEVTETAGGSTVRRVPGRKAARKITARAVSKPARAIRRRSRPKKAVAEPAREPAVDADIETPAQSEPEDWKAW
ncbi:MAG: metalloregulator ArsR/SmtB family transcription factor [Thermoanaerobaculia bacterium]